MSSIVKPRTIRVDASTICQLRCPECPNGRRELNKSDVGSGFLQLNDFDSLLDQSPWVSEVDLTSWGETFLNPDLLDILRSAFLRKLRVTAGSNLNGIRRELLEGIVRYRLLSLNCSIDGATHETYARYRVNGNFEEVMDNIKEINYFKKRNNSKYPILKWQFLVFGYNEHEILQARKRAESLGMEFVLALPFNTDFPLGRPLDCEFSPVMDKELVREELGYSSHIECKEKYGRYPVQGACQALWVQPTINWNGTVMGCCATRFGFGGNAFREGLLASINNEKMQYARLMLTGKMPARDDIPCSDCTLYLEMADSGQWLKRSFVYRALRFTYGNINLPYSTTRRIYRSLHLNRFWE